METDRRHRKVSLMVAMEFSHAAYLCIHVICVIRVMDRSYQSLVNYTSGCLGGCLLQSAMTVPLISAHYRFLCTFTSFYDHYMSLESFY